MHVMHRAIHRVGRLNVSLLYLCGDVWLTVVSQKKNRFSNDHFEIIVVFVLK